MLQTLSGLITLQSLPVFREFDVLAVLTASAVWLAVHASGKPTSNLFQPLQQDHFTMALLPVEKFLNKPSCTTRENIYICYYNL